MKDFNELIRSRKSIRSFADAPVPRDVIERVIEAGTYAPTNCNQQLWNFIVINDSAVKERLINEAAGNTLMRRAPVAIAVSYDGWNCKEAIQGGALAVGYMLLAAEREGLGALPMNSYGADSKVKNILGLPPTEMICCFVLLGYPDERARLASSVSRRPLPEVIHWQRFSQLRRIPSYTYDPEQWSGETLADHQRYYCRKTFLGKEMDIMAERERELVRRELADLSGPILDFVSYDGAFVREFPQSADITTLDLSKETAAYTDAAARLHNRSVHAQVWDDRHPPSGAYRASTILFKIERLPKKLREAVYRSASGELIIIARRRNLFLSLFFLLIRLLFGHDVRRTGIFAFFGPYRPISVGRIVRELRTAGYHDVRTRGYFAFPAYFEQAYQMFLQYRASEGSSYLHRERRKNIIATLIHRLLSFQGFARFGSFGSVVIIRCRK